MSHTTTHVTQKPNGADDKIAFVLIFVPCFVVLLSFAISIMYLLSLHVAICFNLPANASSINAISLI